MANDDGDAAMAEVIDAMEDVNIPDQPSTRRRPLDQIRANGPPANPIPFEKLIFEHGRRDDVLVYCEHNQQHVQARNVLFRDYSRDYGETPERALSRVKQAYWPIPHKQRIKTIMGHVEICYVLKRSIQEDSNYLSDDDDSKSSCSYDDEEVDVVFQLTSQRVAVKVNYGRRMQRFRNKHAEDPVKETCAMQLIGNQNPHVMGMVETPLVVGADLNVVMPYASSGDLFEWLQDAQERGRGFPEAEARFYFKQIMDGVRHLHTKGICHRDLSPENVMMDKNLSIIIDMGMAMRVPYTDPNHPGRVTGICQGAKKLLVLPQGTCGKLPYMSPEIYQNLTPFDGGAVDIWTAGTILFCMVTGNRSYSRPQATDPQYYWMTNDLARLLRDWGLDISENCIHLMKNMLQVDPRLRFTLEEVLQHPWMLERSREPVPPTPPL